MLRRHELIACEAAGISPNRFGLRLVFQFEDVGPSLGQGTQHLLMLGLIIPDVFDREDRWKWPWLARLLEGALDSLQQFAGVLDRPIAPQDHPGRAMASPGRA